MFGKTKIATHWDGYPDGLGKDLKEIGLMLTLEQVIEVAKKHGIDFATKDVQEKTSMERFEQIAQKTKGKYTAQQLADLYYKEGRIITFGVQTASDYPIDEFNGYSTSRNTSMKSHPQFCDTEHFTGNTPKPEGVNGLS